MQSNSSRSHVAGLLVVIAVAALLVAPQFSGLWISKAKEIERIVLPDGSILVVHAVLTEPQDAYSVSDGAIFLPGSALIATQDPGTGVKVVLSRRDAQTDDYLSMDWFGRIELEDKQGDKTLGWQVVVMQADGSGRRSSGGTGDEPEYLKPIRKGYRLLVVSLPHVSPAEPIRFDVIDRDGKKVADFRSPRPFTSQADPGFALASHSTSFSTGDWDLELHEVRARFFGKSINGAKWDPQSQLDPRFVVRHRGDLLKDNHYAIYKLSFADADGNVARSNRMYLSRKQPLWKMSFNIGRTCYNENFADTELSLLGEFDVVNSSSPIHLSPESLKPTVMSMVYFPKGDHTTQLKEFVSSRMPPHFDFNFQGGQNWYGLQWMSGYQNTHASGSSGNSFSGSNHLRVGELESTRCEALFKFSGPLSNDAQSNSSIQFGGPKNSKGIEISSKSNCCLLAIELDEATQRQVLNMIAKDQDGTRLVVHPMEHVFPNLPTYAVETLPTTTALRIYGCVDKLEYVEMFIKPPTAGLDVLNDPLKHSSYRIVAEQEGWKVVEENQFEMQ